MTVDPKQINLPFEATTAEERALLRAIKHENVQAICSEITEKRWANAYEVLLKLFSLNFWDRKIPRQSTLADQLPE